MDPTFEERCRSLVEELGICDKDDVSSIRRLSGGVASDIAAVTSLQKTVCVKFALNKLRVEEDWFAPVHRGKAEFAWLQFAGQLVPESVPKLYGWSDDENGFAMEYLDGPDVVLWKSSLLAGDRDSGQASAVAAIVGRIHAVSAKPEFDRTAFDTAEDFESLRIDPYLRFTVRKHPDLARQLTTLAEQLAQSRLALIHGDVSPKNVLLRDKQPIILDAECASMGDPAFDVAFCLNHLLLKSIHLPESRNNLRTATEQFWHSYAPHITWEEKDQMETRVTALLPALMLARVDGKSPVEYLSETSRSTVRAIARSLIITPVNNLKGLLGTMKQEVEA